MRRMRTLLLSLLLLLAAVVPAGAAGWDRVDAPSESGRAYVYRSAAAFGDRGAWAVGYSYGTVGGLLDFRALIERWDGESWSQAPTPATASSRELLFDVAATDATHAWAVGSFAAPFGTPPTRPLVLAWDGASWSGVDGPVGFGGALTAVAAASDGTVWIGGEGRVWRRAGSSWQEVPFPNVPGCTTSSNGLMARAELTDIASRGPRATWATGYCAVPGGGERGFLVRFNGARWLPVVTPDELTRYGPRGQLTGVSTAPDGQVWAVGWSDDFGVASRSVAFHGNRGAVKPVPAPAQGTGAALYAVATEASGAAVAAGAFTQSGGSAPHPHLLGTDGSGGMAVEPANPSVIGNLYGVALSPGGTAWAVGVSSSDDRGLIMQRIP
jgi:hypothetical protein